VNVGEMQRKLSQWAERDKNHRFFDLYHLLYDKECHQRKTEYDRRMESPLPGKLARRVR
jgi:hypothetical protein